MAAFLVPALKPEICETPIVGTGKSEDIEDGRVSTSRVALEWFFFIISGIIWIVFKNHFFA